ncbi:uncharacterized protein LOC134540044 [Bacillus rossius redtenbacheri]|uniref:uncharacterized protein LOC134540044 n=1 Tax=Bacillus rossius redtenbacheri TaxID=93214 RepID=UPI002FDC927D
MSAAGTEVTLPECLEPLHTAAKLLGLEAFGTVDPAEGDGRRRRLVKWCNPDRVHKFLVVVVTLVFHAFDTHILLACSNERALYVFVAGYVCSTNIVFFGVLGDIFLMSREAGRKRETMAKLAEVDDLISGVGARTSARQRRRRRNRNSAILAFMLLLFVSGCASDQFLFTPTPFVRVVGVGANLKDFAHLIVAGMYVNIVLLVRDRFRTLNHQLRNSPRRIPDGREVTLFHCRRITLRNGAKGHAIGGSGTSSRVSRSHRQLIRRATRPE